MKESFTAYINLALNKLTHKEADILTLSFGLGDTPVCSLQEIATKYGMSAERIRQIKSKALFKLKQILQGNYNLWDY